MQGQIRWNGKKYELIGKQNKVVARSVNQGHLIWLVDKQVHPKVKEHGITSYAIVSHAPDAVTVLGPNDQPANDKPLFSINERFDFTRELATMVLQKKARALIVGGEGGIGKTYTITQTANKLGLVDKASLLPSVGDLDEIAVDDDEEAIEAKITSQMSVAKGDYVIVKGHASAKALYRIMYENRNQVIIFDDCDKVLLDPTAVLLLKPALDSDQAQRIVSWRVEGFAKDDDLPSNFPFHGSIIFITNKSLDKVDEAVRTRCYKVDVTMTFPQRIERMEAVLADVMPEVDLAQKQECMDLMKENLHLCKDVNFRALMNLINIRINDTVSDWKRLALFALLEH